MRPPEAQSPPDPGLHWAACLGGGNTRWSGLDARRPRTRPSAVCSRSGRRSSPCSLPWRRWFSASFSPALPAAPRQRRADRRRRRRRQDASSGARRFSSAARSARLRPGHLPGRLAHLAAAAPAPRNPGGLGRRRRRGAPPGGTASARYAAFAGSTCASSARTSHLRPRSYDAALAAEARRDRGRGERPAPRGVDRAARPHARDRPEPRPVTCSTGTRPRRRSCARSRASSASRSGCRSRSTAPKVEGERPQGRAGAGAHRAVGPRASDARRDALEPPAAADRARARSFPPTGGASSGSAAPAPVPGSRRSRSGSIVAAGGCRLGDQLKSGIRVDPGPHRATCSTFRAAHKPCCWPRSSPSPTLRSAKLIVERRDADRTTAEAKAMNIKGLVASYQTFYGGEANRIHNVQLVVAPGRQARDRTR